MGVEATTAAPVAAEAVEAFAAGVRGRVLVSGDEGYEEARAIRNGLIDRRPALIVQCTGAADVVDSVNFAREHDLLLSIRAGGHNVAGNAVSDGGLTTRPGRSPAPQPHPGRSERVRYPSPGQNNLVGAAGPPRCRPGSASWRRLACSVSATEHEVKDFGTRLRRHHPRSEPPVPQLRDGGVAVGGSWSLSPPSYDLSGSAPGDADGPFTERCDCCRADPAE